MVELADIITPENVILNLPSCSSKRQVLTELARRGAVASGIEQQSLLDALTERERLGTTGIGHGIAIPHARLEGLDHLVGMFVRLDHPVDFEALDEQPSDLIFLLLAPSAAEADSLKALARISRLLRDPGLRQRPRRRRSRRSPSARARTGFQRPKNEGIGSHLAVMPGRDPGMRAAPRCSWMAGSSPAMTSGSTEKVGIKRR